MSELHLEGGCLCGKARYQVNALPIAAAICHCRSCQRAAGAESVGWAVCSRRSFQWLGSQPTHFESSEGVVRTFCDTCGTTLTYQCKDESIDVTLATLDNPEQLPPTKEVWLRHRISWNRPNPSLAGFNESST